MNKNDEDKRRILTGMFQYNDYLINEQLIVKALNDKEKQEWFNNETFEIKDKEIERLKEENTNLKLMLEDEKKRRLSSEKLFSNYRLKLIREQNKITKKCLIEKNERLNNIIKEAREYIEIIVKSTPSSTRKDYANMLLIDYKKLLEILDKGE